MARISLVNTKNVSVRPLINIGCLFDIPTSSLIKGDKGETIYNGGVSPIFAIVGTGNTYKSTILHYFMLTAMDRMEATIPDESILFTYDSENNLLINIDKINNMGSRLEYIKGDLIKDGIWNIHDKSMYSADEWVKDQFYGEFIKAIEENDKKITYTSFKALDGKSNVTNRPPNFLEIDSLTEFEPSSTMDVFKDKSLDKTRMSNMEQGLFKSRLLRDLPTLSGKYNIYIGMTSHIGEKKDVSGNIFSKPTKDLQFLKQNERIKGSTDKLLFLSTLLYKAYGTTILKNQSTGLPEFPKYENDTESDLNLVKLVCVRNKTGPSGFNIDVVVSQSEGVLPSLTEFYYIKNNKYGIEGSNRSYYLTILPDVKLSRTTVRKLLDENYKLRRAVNITAELLQLTLYKKILEPIVCTPKELYEDIKNLGYDWDLLLNTRGWWTIDQYSTKIKPYLSTVDLLKMRKGLYHPYWLDDKKKLKKEYEWIMEK